MPVEKIESEIFLPSPARRHERERRSTPASITASLVNRADRDVSGAQELPTISIISLLRNYSLAGRASRIGCVLSMPPNLLSHWISGPQGWADYFVAVLPIEGGIVAYWQPFASSAAPSYRVESASPRKGVRGVCRRHP